ncbi:MAG: hypothetical protein IJZ25_02895 [Lachnospiraceae bacterium]|nr:hypothetical protein [Lachnospiraceae bacterium]
MIVVMIVVFAFICLCLWNVVKTGTDNDSRLDDLFADEEKMNDDIELDPGSILYNHGFNMDDLSTEYAEEIFDERFDDVYGRM